MTLVAPAMAVPPRPKFAAPLRIGGERMPSRYSLAPLAGYTNVALRLTVRELGGLGLATTDLVNARALLNGTPRSLELLATAPGDTPLSVQIYGSEPSYLRDAAQKLVAEGTRHLDINMGCPVHKVTKCGSGSALMCAPAAAIELVQAVVEAVPVPVTVKMRLGWDDQTLSAPYFAREFEQIGVAAVTVHGRTRAQGFSGTINPAGIRSVVEAVERIPVIGNGDVRTLSDAARMLAVTGCHGIAIGRGALLNPWFFKQLVSWEETGIPCEPPSYFERLELLETHVRRLCEWRSEKYGCIQFRKVAVWYCKVLKPGKAVQQQLVMLDSLQTLDGIVGRLRDLGPPPGWNAAAEWAIPTPKGPNERW